MNTNSELINKLKEFLTEEEIQQGIMKGVIKTDIEKGDDKTLARMPLTDYSAGLASGTGAINQTMAPGASWEMVKMSIQKAIDAFDKATNDMDSFVEKAEYSAEQDSDMEKAYGKMMGSADEMKKVMKNYKAKNMNGMQKAADMDEEKMKDKNMMKAEPMTGQGSPQTGQGSPMVGQGKEKSMDSQDFDRIEKAFDEKISSVIGKNDQLQKVNKGLVEQNDYLQKSMGTLNDTLGKLQADIEKLGSVTPAPKAVNLQAYIEKGGVKDDEGKKIYHVNMHKGQIINELESLKLEVPDIEKAKIDDDILNFATANIAPSEAVSRMLYEKKEVKLVK